MSSSYREKALSTDLERMSMGQEPLSGQDLIYGAGYYDELHAKADRFGLGLDETLTKSRSLSYVSRSTSKESAGWGAPSTKDSKDAKKKMGVVKRILKEDVMYLMIVNMPSEAELAEARVEMAKAEKEAKKVGAAK